MDEIFFDTWIRLRASGELTGADLNLMWSCLERDYAERKDHSGAFHWFSARAVDIALECNTTAFRANERLDAMIARRVLAKSIRDVKKGTRRLWIFHTEQTPPEDVSTLDPQIQLAFDSGETDAGQLVDNRSSASIQSNQPGDGPAYRPGYGQEHRPEDAPEIRPARVPEGCGTAVHGSETISFDSPPSLNGEGGRVSFAPKVTTRTKWSAPSGAPQMERSKWRASNGAPQMVRDDEDDDEVSLIVPAYARSVSLSSKEERETSSSSSSVAARPRTKWSAPSGAPQMERGRRRPARDRLRTIAHWLATIDPASMPWPEIRQVATAAGAKVRTPGSDRLGRQAHDLVLAAAIVAAVVPELGMAWIERAAGYAPQAKSSRRGYFCALLAEGLELADLCAEGQGQRAWNRLQLAAGQAIAWFDANLKP